MNICFVASSLGIGGLERVVTLVGEAINGKENIVYYFSIDNKTPYWKINDEYRLHLQKPSLNKYSRQIMKAAKLIDYLKNWGQLDINRYQRYFIKNIIEYVNEKKIDVLILTSAHQISAIPIIKKKCKNIKIIAWIHQSHQAIVKNSRKFSLSFINGIKAADKVICLTDSTEMYFSHINKKTMKIYNPISISGKNRVSKLSSSNISFVSRISLKNGDKGLDLLIKLAKVLPANIHITIAGGGSHKEEKKFSKIITEKKLQNKIIWQGPKRGENLIKHYLASTIFISTSRTEGFSLVILEAMSLGLPVIATPTTGARELLGEGKFGILSELSDINHFSEKIQELLGNPEELLRLQKLSIKRSHDFDKDNIVAKWVQVLETI